jgi:hypothetical protein
MATQTELLINKADITDTSFRERDIPQIADGEVLFKVDFFAFTSNNISYAVMGDQFGYWQFFPAGEDGKGIIPTWGFADVVESRHPDIKEGERIYGYLPMASHVVMMPGRVKDTRFVDEAPHRSQLPPIYNDYVRVAADPYADPALEPYRALWFPLAGTSYGLFDWLEQTNYSGAEAVCLVSASSKTSLGLACLLSEKKDGKRIIGVTSPRNVASVEKIGWYDEVITYDDVAKLDAATPTVMVDFSGNGERLSAMHAHLGDNMKHMAIVGASHWDEERRGDGYNQDRSKLFFMPAYAVQRMEETGGAFRHDLAAASKRIAEMASKWMETDTAASKDDILSLYTRVKDGTISAETGGIMSFSNL